MTDKTRVGVGDKVLKRKKLRITKKEAEKVMHDINNDWHVKYADLTGEICMIETHSHRSDSPGYMYYFINHGFSNYEYVAKYRIY